MASRLQRQRMLLQKFQNDAKGFDCAEPVNKPTPTSVKPSPSREILPEPSSFVISEDCEITELLPGFVHMKQALPIETQQALLNISCKVTGSSRKKKRSGGWYRLQKDGQWKLNDGTKARFWDDASLFPESVKELGELLATMASKRFPDHLSDPCSKFQSRVIALNYYTNRGRMGWHADDTNFAKPERPIVMASFGHTAEFGYKMSKQDSKQSVFLQSGDVIVFGGPSRNLVHSLIKVTPKTCPRILRFPKTPGVGRVSLTWRDVGPEDGLVFNSDERLGLKKSKHALQRYRRR